MVTDLVKDIVEGFLRGFLQCVRHFRAILVNSISFRKQIYATLKVLLDKPSGGLPTRQFSQKSDDRRDMGQHHPRATETN